MLSGRYKIEKDKDGAIIINLDGTHFRIILNFLRDNILPDLTPTVKQELMKEAEYYQLDDLVALLKK